MKKLADIAPFSIRNRQSTSCS